MGLAWADAVAVNGCFGASYATVQMWGFYGAGSCNGRKSLICLQTGSGPALAVTPSAGKVAFVTSVSGTGNLSSWADAGGHTGLDAADAICQARAAAGSLANPSRFKAWISTSTTAARDRITGAGPWIRPSGVLVARDRQELLGGTLLSTIHETELGTGLGWAF